MELSLPSMSEVCEDRIKEHMQLLCNMRRKAALQAHKAAEQMVERQRVKDPPSMYNVGERVLLLVESKKWNKVRGKGVAVNPSCEAEVLACNIKLDKYKVKCTIDGKEVSQWVHVSKILSLTRAEENMREKNVQGMSYNIDMHACILVNILLSTCIYMTLTLMHAFISLY